MKTEHYIYAAFVLLISTLLLFEAIHHTSMKTEFVLAEDVCKFDRMLIDFDCNVFITVDENENIVLEGSDRMIREIQWENNGETLRLKRVSKGLISMLRSPIKGDDNKINVYIRISDPGKIMISDNMTVISSEYRATSKAPFFSSIATLLTTMLPG